MLKSDSIANIASALLKAQKEMGNALKDSKNPFFKSSFADLNSVREAVTPALHAAGITVLQLNVHYENNSFVRTTLLHESGEFICSDTQIICAKPNDPQAQGSAISYARRYGLSSMLSVGAVDDDGEKAMSRNSVKAAQNISNQVVGKEALATATNTGIQQATTNSDVNAVAVKKSTFRKPAKTTEVKPASDNLDDWIS